MARETGADLFTVASPGRSGTMWYARLFTTPRSHCFHELTTVIHRYPTNFVVGDRIEGEVADHSPEQADRRRVLEGFPVYYQRLLEQAGRGFARVGNSDHLATPLLRGLWLLWPRMRFLFSFRNGVNQVGSMAVWESQAEPALVALWRTSYGAGDYFELCCRDWSATVAALAAHRSWLHERGADVLETRFERVLGDDSELARVCDWVLGDWDDGADRARELTRTVVNARTGAERVLSPDEVWEGWPPERRKLFASICGATQTRLGYTLPRA
jgi:hypothetical protein